MTPRPTAPSTATTTTTTTKPVHEVRFMLRIGPDTGPAAAPYRAGYRPGACSVQARIPARRLLRIGPERCSEAPSPTHSVACEVFHPSIPPTRNSTSSLPLVSLCYTSSQPLPRRFVNWDRSAAQQLRHPTTLFLVLHFRHGRDLRLTCPVDSGGIGPDSGPAPAP